MTDAATAPTTAQDAAFAAFLVWCFERGLTPERLGDAEEGYLGVRLQGATRTWDLYVDCNEKRLKIPKVKLGMPRGLLAHVGYGGTVCVNDGQNMSVDIDRKADVVAHTLLEAYDLVERSAADATAGMVEFFNELEGYWSGLPGWTRARMAFEVDRRDRLITAYVNAKKPSKTWYLSERNQPLPKELEGGGLAAQRALYVHLDQVPLPPAHPDRLTASFVEAVKAKLSSAQLELWTQLVGPSKNGPKLLTVLISVPRAAGGSSLIGVAFTAKGGQVDTCIPVTPLTIRRHTASYMRERGGASLELIGKHVAVLGCGAVGSVVADCLAAAGVGKLTLVDLDEYTEDNVFRHLLGPHWVDIPKVRALRAHLMTRYPGLQVEPINDTAQEWVDPKTLAGIDGIVIAFGQPSVERSFSRYFRDKTLAIPVVFTWLEALDLGGHSVLSWTNKEGCLECLYRDDEGQPSLAPRSSFMEPGQSVTRNLTGCGSIFVPFGALQARRTGLMAAEHLLCALGKSSPASYRYWVGDGAAAAEAGLRTTPWHKIAANLPQVEATQRVFGRPCKHCRSSA